MDEINKTTYQLVWFEEHGKKMTMKDKTYTEIKPALEHGMSLMEHTHIPSIKLYARSLKAVLR